MTSTHRPLSPLAVRYASALIDLSADGKVLEKVEKNFQELESMIRGSSDLQAFLKSPLIARNKQQNVVFALADKAKFEALTKSFLGTLSYNRRLGSLLNIIQAFYQEVARRRGQVDVNVTTAVKLDAKQVKSLSSAISKTIGSEVILTQSEDPNILGGMIVRVGSVMVDDSVARKLERLKAAMQKQSNENITLQEAKGA